MEAAVAVGKQQALVDQKIDKEREQHLGRSTVILLDRILVRQGGTRAQEQGHVLALAENIALIGLLHPIVTDCANRVIAGSHRLAALHLLHKEKYELFLSLFPNELVPVRIMPFDSNESPDMALNAEISENEHRRDYNREEIIQLADRMRTAGYKDSPGRPKDGDRPLTPALMVALGKSRRSVVRLLTKPNKKVIAPNGAITDAIRRRAAKALQLAIKRYLDLMAQEQSGHFAEIAKSLSQIESFIEEVITSVDIRTPLPPS